ncbi:phosphotransferase [Lacinutrix sp. C3R15]|uniref:phosphotransferase n=1 Tax=Flavobacteriaceae TaxID=49546 RepID=UPI001C08BF59|nr:MULTISPECIES: phosphotransferase [Flavobacteriaceae]MBU2940368.1 phosphotransferase [Lacinutrix sp. C3R15]MDO6623688.1 phosphotransferase [Oceanihabitans sp. 1_MG-2023]
MDYAPAISSILSPKYLAGLVKQRYNLDATTTCSILKTGINHTYLITEPNTKYVLRVYFLDWRTQNEIEEELQLLDFLKANGISVSFPIKDKNNQYIQSIPAFEGKRYAVLFSYAKGETVRNPSKEVCFTLGETMAKFHQLTLDKHINRIDYTAKTLVNDAFNSANTFFKKNTEEMAYYQQANTIITSKFENADTSKLRKGIVHLDFWYENLKVKETSEITVFDFDNCGNGWLFLDLSYTLMILFRNEANKDNFKEKQASFYQGYTTIAHVSDEEKKLIPYGGLAIWLHYNSIHINRFNDFSNPFLSEDFLKYWIHTVKQWMEFNGIKI